MKPRCAALVLGCALSASAAGQNMEAVVDECEACHGPQGVSTEPDVPTLAGKSVTYIREVLDQFYNFERHCTTTTYRHGDRPKTPMNMCIVANTLSDEEKQWVAEYFANAEALSASDP